MNLSIFTLFVFAASVIGCSASAGTEASAAHGSAVEAALRPVKTLPIGVSCESGGVSLSVTVLGANEGVEIDLRNGSAQRDDNIYRSLFRSGSGETATYHILDAQSETAIVLGGLESENIGELTATYENGLTGERVAFAKGECDILE